jgi:hypothetical protein
MEIEAAAGAVSVPVPGPGVEAAPVKRRRGRPRKTELPGGGKEGAAPDPAKPRKQRKRKGEAVGGAPSSVDVSMIGQQVTGVLDGTFDAGYLLTVRVGASDTILHGVVFGPGLSVPLSRANDVAPGVKHVRREERPLSKLPISAKPPVASKLPLVIPPARPFPSPLPHIPPTQAVLENAAALFTNSITPPPPPPTPPVTGLVAALQQLPGGGYTPDPSTFSQSTFQSI